MIITGADIYKVVAAMVPLYVALGLGYGSIRWWRMFKSDQCDAINRFNCYFIIPFFTFQFTARVDPYHMNLRFLAGDVMAKAIVGVVLVLWAKLSRKGDLSWAVTSFSLSSLNNTLVVGVPLLKAMYGTAGEDLVVQSSVIQSLLWFPLLLFLLDFWRVTNINYDDDIHQISSIQIVLDTSSSSSNIAPLSITAQQQHQDPYNNNNIDAAAANGVTQGTAMKSDIIISSPNINNFRLTSMKKVWAKLAKNPNLYACALGLIWALLSKRWGFEMPSIMEGSVLIMAKAGSGVAMFSMGLFMGLQEKVIACGIRLTMYGMVMRFVGGPLTTLIGSLALGLRSNILHIVIIQAALPQAISSFVFAQEYGLHANVLSTAVIFGTIVSLPLLIAYYIALDVLH